MWVTEWKGAFLLLTLLRITHCPTARRAHTGAALSNPWFVFNHRAICFHKTYRNLRLSNSLFQSCSKVITYSTSFSLGNHDKTQLQYNDVNNTAMTLKKSEWNLISRCAKPSQEKIQWVSDLNLLRPAQSSNQIQRAKIIYKGSKWYLEITLKTKPLLKGLSLTEST